MGSGQRWLVMALRVCAVALTVGACQGREPICLESRAFTVPIGAAEDTTFWVGPYLQHTTTESVAIGWETEASGSTSVEYGADEAYGGVAEGPAGPMHQLVVTGLRPATLYHYRACTDGTCTADLTFSTAPERAQPFRFVVYGDTQTEFEVHRAMVEAVIGDQPVMMLHAGDVVGDGNDRSLFKTEFFDPRRRLGHHTPVWVAAGNHEQKQFWLENFRDYFMFPFDPADPVREPSYSFTFGDAFFLVVDTDDTSFSPLMGEEAVLWTRIKAAVASRAAVEAKWRFAIMHYPPDSRCLLEGEYPPSSVRDYVVPLLRASGFHASFHGHVHLYERLDYDGFPAIITGGGAGGLEDPVNCAREVAESVALTSVHHRLIVDLGCDRAVIRAVDLDGHLLDEVGLVP
jgi:acid phosphatase type 7